jgi:hypothetical protein
MKRWLFVALALAACSKPKVEPPPQAPVSVCPKVADHLVSLMSGAAKHPPEATDPLRRVIGERCDKDQWSVEAKQCLLQLASLAEGERCQAMMTPAQIDAFQRGSEGAAVELRGQLVEEPAKPTPSDPPQNAAPPSAAPTE